MKFDIFISFKHTDENGYKTRDFEIAKILHQRLTNMGYSTFFSTDTLEKLGSSRYKDDIDNALDTAKVMIVVLTKEEYAKSHWVHYEWDSFYNDYLSGVKKDANLFTLTKNVNINSLPRTLRQVQNFNYDEGLEEILKFVSNALPSEQKEEIKEIKVLPENNIKIVTGKEITSKNIEEAVILDTIVYDKIYHVGPEICEEWFNINPDIYIMAIDESINKVVGYVNVSPVTDECYDNMRNGNFIDSNITTDMILSYDLPYAYSLVFSSIVIHPNYQNSEVLLELFNAIINKFLRLGEREVFIKRMIADAVSESGEKFCKLFGMTKIQNSSHNSTLYEISMIPPKFRIISKMTKRLYDYYQSKYNEAPYLFENNIE